MIQATRMITFPATATILATVLVLSGCSSSGPTAEEIELERIAACESTGGRWNDDATCTPPDVLQLEAIAACDSADGRWEGTHCTSAAELELEAIAACESAGGRWENASCTSSESIEHETIANCVEAGGRWEGNHCTSALEIERETIAACEGAGGRWEADDTCTSASEIVQERITACESGGGRWEADQSQCTSPTELAREETEKQARTKIAMAMEHAIAMQIPAAGLGGSNQDGEPIKSYAASVASDGVTVMITDSTMMDKNDPKFVQTMDLTDKRTRHVRTTTPQVEEIVLFQHDRAAPTSVAFAMFKAADGTLSQTLDVSTNTDNDAPDATYEALGVDHTDNELLPLLMLSSLDLDLTGTLEYEADDLSTDEDEAFETAGTYNDALGTYRCNAMDQCTVTLAEGKISDISKGWIFTPNEGAQSLQPDYDYLHYGVWMKKTTTMDGKTAYNEIAAFSGASMDLSDADELADVEGSAVYEGAATGVYTMNTYTPHGTIAHATSGDFTADVSLTAYFGGDDTPASIHNTITGTIDRFMLSDAHTPGWSATLQGARNGNMFSGTIDTDRNKSYDNGMFSGAYHGATPMNEATASTTDRLAPGVLAGEFNASFSNGETLGGFGARKSQ